MRPIIALAPLLALLAACGSSSSPVTELPDGRVIDVAGFESYTTDHNGFSRVRRSYATDADAAVIAGFEDGDPSDPAGYRNLIALNEELYGGRMNIEVIAEVDTPDGPAQRLLRLTADAAPFTNVENGELIAATGQFYLRGSNFSWVSIDDGPLLSGADQDGLVNMVIDFDTESVNLNLRTGVNDGSDVRMEILVEDMPLNIITGGYGGDITIRVWDPDGPDILDVDGTLLGNLAGSPRYEDDQHDLATAGLYTAEGTDSDTGREVRVDGVFFGMDPNGIPDH
ncbi:viral aspartic protease [Pararhodobacter zhoushanensis]|uniref:viral aspartic protease n=1 Tax=Pararhodobacter zhoushanensis TaxID=2479545 RepID=UPI000F8E4134|nr:viral aspartic protease [Pararhodobacter zhoushanensis]